MAALMRDPRAANSKEVYPLQHFLTAGGGGSGFSIFGHGRFCAREPESVYLRCICGVSPEGLRTNREPCGLKPLQASLFGRIARRIYWSGRQGKDPEHEMIRPQQLLFALSPDDRACVSVSRPSASVPAFPGPRWPRDTRPAAQPSQHRVHFEPVDQMVVGRSHAACTDQRPWVILEHYERALRETDLVLEVSDS